MGRRSIHYSVPFILGLSLIGVSPDPLHADVILTFAPTCPGSGGVIRSSLVTPYIESGYQIAEPGNGQLGSWCALSPNYNGTSLLINEFGGTATLSAISGQTFSVFSIDLANLFAGSSQPGTLTFTGHFLGGGVIAESFTFALGATSPPVFSTYTFAAAFQNLTSLDFPIQGNSQGSAPLYQFTNVRLSTVSVTPEPASLMLLGTGVFALVIGVRLRSGPWLPRS